MLRPAHNPPQRDPDRWIRVQSYGEFAGVRIPASGEAVYARPGGDYSYIRLRITEVEYDVPRRY